MTSPVITDQEMRAAGLTVEEIAEAKRAEENRASQSEAIGGGGAISVKQAFCDPANIVTEELMEAMTGSLCGLDKNSRRLSVDRAASVSKAMSVDNLIMFARSARESGRSSELETKLEDLLFNGLGERVKSNSVMIPFETGNGHWVTVKMDGQKQADGSFSYKSSEINTDGISRPIRPNLYGILGDVVESGGGTLENQLEPKVKIFDYHLQFGQNCGVAVAMMTSALVDNSLDAQQQMGHVVDISKFIDGKDIDLIRGGEKSIASGSYNQRCDTRLREIAFDAISKTPNSENFPWRKALSEYPELIDFSDLTTSSVAIDAELATRTQQEEVGDLDAIEAKKAAAANHEAEGVEVLTDAELAATLQLKELDAGQQVEVDAQIAAQLQQEENAAVLENVRQGLDSRKLEPGSEVVTSSEEQKAAQIAQINLDREMAENMAKGLEAAEGKTQQEIYESIVAKGKASGPPSKIPTRPEAEQLVSIANEKVAHNTR